MTKEPKLNQRLTTHAAQTVLPGHKKVGRPKGSPKAPGSGRKAGPNRHTVEKEEMMANAIKDVFKSLTIKEIDDITPLRVMHLCMVAAVRSGSFGLALMSAEKLAPYTHAKLAPKIVDATDANTVHIVGGLPETNETYGSQVH